MKSKPKSDPPNPLTLFMNVPNCKSLIKVRSQYWIESRISDNIDSINYFFFEILLKIFVHIHKTKNQWAWMNHNGWVFPLNLSYLYVTSNRLGISKDNSLYLWNKT